MITTVVLVAFVALVALLAWRTRGSPNMPRTCCSAQQWPPDDLTGAAPPPCRDGLVS